MMHITDAYSGLAQIVASQKIKKGEGRPGN